MFRPGRRLFSAASVGLLVVAGLHTLGHFSPPPDSPGARALMTMMQGYRFPLGLGMEPSAYDITRSLSLTMSLTLFWLAVQNLVVARTPDASDGLVRTLNWVSAVGVGALVALYAAYRVPPPMLTLAAVEVVFALGLLVSRRGPR